MVKLRFILAFILIQFSVSGLFAQEFLQGLSVNPALLKKDTTQAFHSKLKSQVPLNHPLYYPEANAGDILNIPFVDDFSSTSIYPDTTLWEDKSVIVNSKYSIGPPSKGVATFDALNSKGQLYDSVLSKPFYADTLTSKPINLLTYSGRKDIFLSFFYQPQGGGVPLSAEDSLILDFYNPTLSNSIAWKKVWAIPGSSLQPFKEVLLQVDSPFLQRGFRFRFRNLATVKAEDSSRLKKVGFWHIDNVRLDKNRNANDSLIWWIKIPFIDDFSSTSLYPDSTLWADQLVIINSKYSMGPPNNGVATFDAFNRNGELYDTVHSKPFYADMLTSRPINLEYSNRKDIFLSFFYQPQGGGVPLSVEDSLILDFYNPTLVDSIAWKTVWALPGSSLQAFKEVLLQVDTPYLQKGFSFRFRTLATVNVEDSSRLSKVGFWHIDNVRLDKNRNANDSLNWCINIPFIDDFSSTTIYPDPNRWIDRYAYINSTLAVAPPSVGVATLDAIDENGLIYSRASSSPFYADQLTSKPFNLGYSGRDDIFLSFFYQPQGIGDAPEPGDSLMVDFYNPTLVDSIAWIKVWAVPGDSVYPFKQTMIKVTSQYQQKGLRFRFRNIASLSANSDLPGKHGNVDFWHVDYVRLDTGRSINDTVVHDVAFVKPMTSLLKTYQAMPWQHFILAFRNEIKPTIVTTYKNNDNFSHGVTRYLVVKDLYGTGVQETPTGKENIDAGETFVQETDLTNPFITSSTDSALFDVRSYLVCDKSDYPWNDTIRFLQVFNNYFARDDGSSETGYGLQGQGSQNAMVAYGFTSYQPDTLTAISIYFNPTEDNITTSDNYYFKLAVWADNNDKPGKLLYIRANSDYKPTQLGQFHPYKLDTGLVVSGKFYVGWVQTNENYLNVGYDLNNNSQAAHFVNLTGTWINSAFQGSLMIRPIFRTKQIPLDINQVTVEDKVPLRVYPNPASNYISIDLGGDSGDGNWIVSLFDISGKMVMQTTLQNGNIDVSGLTNGLYIIKVLGKKTNLQPVKLLIQR